MFDLREFMPVPVAGVLTREHGYVGTRPGCNISRQIQRRHQDAQLDLPTGIDVRHVADDEVTRHDADVVPVILQRLEVGATTYR